MVAGFIAVMLFFVIVAAAVAGSEDSTVTSIKKGSVLRVDFSGVVDDRLESTPIMDRVMGSNETVLALNDLVTAIEKAADDEHIEGIYLECNGAEAGLAQLSAIRTALQRFKESGKWIYSYADSYTQGNYFMATAADSVFINPEGMLDIHGLQSTVMYFKDLLDKVGVKVQVVKVGTYKSAVEPFLLNDMSEANREQMTLLLGNMWKSISGSIAEDRGVPVDSVNSWANSYSYTEPVATYLKNKMVDRSYYRHEVEGMMASLTGKEKPEFVNVDDYLKLRGKKNGKGKGARIAVLYAVGDITENGASGIASERLVPAILDLADNDDIDGLIMRVNSGGGSAYASEQIWEALEQFKKRTGKPFYVSMGDYAASGGYYISCGADCIYAEPLTLTGSIGIFGMIPDAQELLNKKIGINTATVSTNSGSFPSLFEAMTPEQAAAMQNYVNRGYELFTTRCANGRHKSVDDIKKIAEGRVWDGATAKTLGLVDQMGGLDRAIADMAAKINADSGESGYRVTEYPKVKMHWYDELFNMESQLRQRAIREELGESARYYDVLKSVNSMSPLQCRMEYIEIR